MRRKIKNKTKNKTIRFRPALFWDADPKTLDPKKHARYIIERILDFGNDKEAGWIWQTYPRALLSDVVKHSRGLHPQTKVLWEALTRNK